MSETIVFLDHETLGPEVTMRRPSFSHGWEVHGKTTADQVLERAREASILIVNKVPLREPVLDQLPNLKFVAVAATGTDNVDLAACRRRGIPVSNVQAYAVHTVPEHTFSLILALRRSLMAYRESVASGAWQRAAQFTLLDHPIRDLHGSTLGIVGEGAIGQAVAALGRAFGMQVLFSAHKGSTGMGPLYTPFEEVLERSDVLTLHCPLTPQTRDLLGAAEFSRMRRRPIVVNTARGGLIVEADLVQALESGQIAGAAVDAVSVEPPPPDHPFMRLAKRPDFILTPHVGWASREARQEVADQVTACIEAFVAGQPRNLVT
ncbi:D-2-hydroxyacid dehydrogenase (plasmid) [Skermanella mucosa]|uniref:D-2-hydroxyacid dehydrogenase n=1 Tax=Skermanella mucosa TaxID=1789672 RepID=UPI00192CC15A|nr:D-2-hydroxyacid dehydrogenase [Skermanella mucosa]UEM24185.1 D-2-hydroxyacid dehydrogenase [Skermanella mucosa]